MTSKELTARLRAVGRTKAELAFIVGRDLRAVANWGTKDRPMPPLAIALVEAWEQLAKAQALLVTADRFRRVA